MIHMDLKDWGTIQTSPSLMKCRDAGVSSTAVTAPQTYRDKFAVEALTSNRAAPAGGAAKAGRGCLFSVCLAISSVTLLSFPAQADPVSVPSGRSIDFHEMVQESSSYGLTFHFRFVMDALGDGTVEFADVAADMEAACTQFAVPRIATTGPKPARIVVSFASKPSEFGVPSPEIIQFFEAYSLSDGVCIWELF